MVVPGVLGHPARSLAWRTCVALRRIRGRGCTASPCRVTRAQRKFGPARAGGARSFGTRSAAPGRGSRVVCGRPGRAASRDRPSLADLRCASEEQASRMHRKSVSGDAGATQVRPGPRWRTRVGRPARAGGPGWAGQPAPADPGGPASLRRRTRAGAARPSAGVGTHPESPERGRSCGRRDAGASQTVLMRQCTGPKRDVCLASRQDGPITPALSVDFLCGSPLGRHTQPRLAAERGRTRHSERGPAPVSARQRGRSP